MVTYTGSKQPIPLPNVWQPLRGPFARWPRTSDAVLAILLFVLTVAVTFEGQDSDEPTLRRLTDISWATYLVSAVACGALYWRREKPILVWATIVAAYFLQRIGVSDGMAYAMMFGLYAVGRYESNDRWSVASAASTVALFGLNGAADAEPTGEIAFGLVITFWVWYAGRRLRSRGAYLQLLEERAQQLEREQAAEARRAVAEERTRIARELHDVVAHRVSMMTVQSGAAKIVAAKDPEAAVRAMEAVENAGRQALNELRHLLGVLRPESEADELNPQPGLDDLRRLIDQFKDAGLSVSLTEEHTAVKVPARVELSAYRIVQESLTNVLKHAGKDAQTDIGVKADRENLTITVSDNGKGATILPGSGHGIVGMRERAQLLGGSLAAGPRSGGGFEVRARLPIGQDSQ